MRHNITKYLLTLVLALLTLPMQSQDFLTVYLKEGTIERHLMSLVDEISVSKYDREGVLHSDYVSQVIKMKDVEYLYPIDEIDSISFRKVDINQAAEDIANVITTINTLIEGTSYPDFKQIGESISKMTGVEEVLYENDAMIVKTKDWRNIVYYKTPDVVEPSDYPSFTRSSISKDYVKAAPKVNNPVKVAITNQFKNDEDRTLIEEINQDLMLDFKTLGYNVDLVKEIDFDFLYSGIFDYDIILLGTHGLFFHGKHWLLTNYELMVDQSITGIFGQLVNLANEAMASFHDDIDDVCYYCIDEKRNGKTSWVYYAAVSEDYIRKSGSHFNNDAIIFANVCSSLKRTQELSSIFFEKGASVYLGYDNTAYYGYYAGPLFFDSMLYGKSVRQAYNSIPKNYVNEQDTFEKANLLLLTKENDYDSLFITKTITAPNTEVKEEPLDNGKYNITLKGYTSAFGDDIECGFEYSDNPDMNKFQSGSSKMIATDNDNGNYYFELDLSESSGMTIYYRAYTFDGMYHNYGDICYYTIENQDEPDDPVDPDEPDDPVDPDEPDEPISDKELMLSEKVNGVDYKIYKKVIDETDYHENPDGWKCYKSELSLETTANGNTQTIVLDNKIYLDDSRGHHGGQFPCMLIDYKNDRLVIFCNSKDAEYQYSMEGYSYVSSLNNFNFSKEIVFTRANWGWYPFFVENSNGSPTLSHFSYAGYYAMESTRNNNGSWDTAKKSKIKPDEFAALSKQAGLVLVIGDNSGDDNPPSGDDTPTTSCPAKITNVELINAGYSRNEEYPNRLYFSASATLDDLTGVEEWGVYFDYSAIIELPFESVDREMSKTIAYTFKGDSRDDDDLKFDINSYVAEWTDAIGVYVKKRDASSGELTTIYGDKYQFKLRYDTPPSMVLSDPVVVGTEKKGEKYYTTITYKYNLKGAIWVDYVDSAVSGGNWSFDGFDETWYPEYDGPGESEWLSTYTDNTSDLSHTNWRRLHLRNYEVVNSNYVNLTGTNTITEAWVTDSPVYSRTRSGSGGEKGMIRNIIHANPAPAVRKIASYKRGTLGEVMK